LLGKNGEPIADQQIIFALRHPDFGIELPAAVKTDERGRVM